MFALTKYATEVYRNELTRALHGLGYETVPSKHGFEIKGVDPELLIKFSKRAQERDREIAKMEARLGRALDNDEVSVAVHQTRSRKLKGITTGEVRERQLEQMSIEEKTALETLRRSANGFAVRRQTEPQESALAYEHACAHVFERSSVVPREELLRQALISGRGQVDLAALKQEIDQSPELIRVGRDISTKEILQTELYLIQTLNAGKDCCPSLAPGYVPSAQLGNDQREALEHVLRTSDQYTGFRGLAGTGKTSTLKELGRALSESGREVVFCAPTAAATQVLRKDGFSLAMTLAKLLHEDKLIPGSVIVLDEAGLVGARDMKRLFEMVAAKDARLIFSGDTGQHSSVAQGDALRLLEEHSRYSFRELTIIRRQQAEEYRNVVEYAANERPQAAFDRLDRLGWVREADAGRDLYNTAAAAYLESRQNGKSALLVAPTWVEIESVTEAVREQLKQAGALGTQEEKISVFESASWTAAQKRQVTQYSTGQQILFNEDSRTFRKQERVDVIEVLPGKNAVKVQREDGSVHLFRPKAGTSFDVGYPHEIGVAPGDLLLLQANRPKEGLINGQVVSVESVNDGKITLTNGKSLPSDYCEMTHGYCVTSHSAQARTVDAVFLVAGSRSAAAIHQEQFYVSISRGRQECQVFTDDKELLRDRIARSTERQAALELVGDALKEAGFAPPKINEPEAAPNRTPLKIDTFRVSQTQLHNQITRLLKEEALPEHERRFVSAPGLETTEPNVTLEKELPRSPGMSL